MQRHGQLPSQKQLTSLYGSDMEEIESQERRYQHLAESYFQCFSKMPNAWFSVPGRTELGGNHTDHQGGKVLVAGIQQDLIAKAEATDNNCITILSEGFAGRFVVDLNNLKPKAEERASTLGLIRGVAHAFENEGYKLGGFNACFSSNVNIGSGLSSSAAFEVMVGTILNYYYNDGKVTPIQLAMAGKYSENQHFGKPCGMMDQLACAHGGVVALDFEDPALPKVTTIGFNFDKTGYCLLMVDTGSDHSDLTSEYASVPQEMFAAAQALGAERLVDISLNQVREGMAAIRSLAGDRACLRALHFQTEQLRVAGQVSALKRGDFATFLQQVRESGNSSWKWLQNILAPGTARRQNVALALAMSELFVGEEGAVRVHGGGFAGTIQVYMPHAHVEGFRQFLEPCFGPHSVTELHIRHQGAVVFDPMEAPPDSGEVT